VVIWLARHMRAWDPLHDAGMTAIGLALAALALWLNGAALTDLARLSGW
jgi:hypothetical protein